MNTHVQPAWPAPTNGGLTLWHHLKAWLHHNKVVRDYMSYRAGRPKTAWCVLQEGEAPVELVILEVPHVIDRLWHVRDGSYKEYTVDSDQIQRIGCPSFESGH